MAYKSVRPHVIPEIKEWPIHRLYRDRSGIVQEVVDATVRHFMKLDVEEQSNVLARASYLERIRIKEEPWKVDPPDDDAFWKGVRRNIARESLDAETEADEQANNQEQYERIVRRYAEEIAGGFKKNSFVFARKFLTALFKQLLNRASGRNLGRIWGSRLELYDRFHVYGEVTLLRQLVSKGTVVLLPTHSSNLDSILIGYALDAIVGIPAFSYGAGLNLYNTGATAFYMNRLGAYRVDRRKKNDIYLQTLKEYSRLTMERGVHSLFFPGGTRSRSGELEHKLKLGLLGTVIQAQRNNYLNGTDEKIFIVPLVLSYHFVLEAKSLIQQHLKRTGEELYVQQKENDNGVAKLTKFLWQFFSASSDVSLTIGRPFDVIGNYVDADGNSLGHHGKKTSLREYFMHKGRINADSQREQQYTRRLADIVARRYKAENVVLSSHVVALVGFRMLRAQNPDLDLYAVLRLPNNEFEVPFGQFCEGVREVRNKLLELEEDEEIRLSPELELPIPELTRDGIDSLGTYHVKFPLVIQGDKVVSQSFDLLYFYHNRLSVYDLWG